MNIAEAFIMTLLIAAICEVYKWQKILSLLCWCAVCFFGIKIHSGRSIFLAMLQYVTSIVLLIGLICFWQYCSDNESLLNRQNYCLLCALGILNSVWLEQTGLAFVIAVGLYWLIDFIQQRKLNIRFTVLNY